MMPPRRAKFATRCVMAGQPAAPAVAVMTACSELPFMAVRLYRSARKTLWRATRMPAPLALLQNKTDELAMRQAYNTWETGFVNATGSCNN